MTKKNIRSFLRLAATSLLFAAAASTVARAQFVAAPAADEWRAWRGPHGNGVAAKQAPPPTEFSPSENIVWKSIGDVARGTRAKHCRACA